MQARLRRLRADYDRVTEAFADHPFIRLVATEGDPPEKYTFELRVSGLQSAEDQTLLRQETHRAEVFLPLDYPRRPPFARMITPVFHPNIDPQKICIGDHWSAGQSLATVVAQIAHFCNGCGQPDDGRRRRCPAPSVRSSSAGLLLPRGHRPPLRLLWDDSCSFACGAWRMDRGQRGESGLAADLSGLRLRHRSAATPDRVGAHRGRDGRHGPSLVTGDGRLPGLSP